MKIYKGTPPSENPDSIYVANSLRFEEKYVALDSISGQSALKLITLNNKAYQIDSLKSHVKGLRKFLKKILLNYTRQLYSEPPRFELMVRLINFLNSIHLNLFPLGN